MDKLPRVGLRRQIADTTRIFVAMSMVFNATASIAASSAVRSREPASARPEINKSETKLKKND